MLHGKSSTFSAYLIAGGLQDLVNIKPPFTRAIYERCYTRRAVPSRISRLLSFQKKLVDVGRLRHYEVYQVTMALETEEVEEEIIAQ